MDRTDVHIHLSDGEVARTVYVFDWFLVDYDEDWVPLGVEILGAGEVTIKESTVKGETAPMKRLRNPLTGLWTHRKSGSGQFKAVEKTGGNFKGMRKI